MAMEQKRTEDWYRLDLSAIVYPTLQRRDFSSVYRLSVVLKEEIDPAVLQQAVDQVMPRFPIYKAAIRKGVFWRYLEPNNRPGPFVQPDVKNPCQPMHFKGNNRYLVRFYYYGGRIALEGQVVDVDFGSGVVFVDGKPLQEEYIQERTFTAEGTAFPLTVPEGSVFVLGDNRNHSTDSRDARLGTVDTRYIIGRAVFLAFPGPDAVTGMREYNRMGGIG